MMRPTREQRDAEARNARERRSEAPDAGVRSRRGRKLGEVFDRSTADAAALASAMPSLLGHLLPQNALKDPRGYAAPDRPNDSTDD